MNTQTSQTHVRKSRTTISLEPWLLDYAAEVGRGNVSLGVRYVLLEYRSKLDPEVRSEAVSGHAGANSGGIED